MHPPDPHLAATVILLRPGPSGPEVFLVQRDRRVGFMPSAWVFPGGRIDPDDARIPSAAVRGLSTIAAQLALPEERARGLAVGAIRETFEESGIWLGEGAPTVEDRQQLCDRTSSVHLGAVVARTGCTLDAASLTPFSRWVTPTAEPRRYDTWFFVAAVPAGTAARHDDGETVQSAWLPVPEALERAERGALPMAPPTWWTLRQLADLGDLRTVFAGPHDLRPICPILRELDGTLTLVLPGHPAHPEPARPALPAAIDFAQGRWWARGGGG